MKEPQWKNNNEGFKSNTQQLLEDTHRPDSKAHIFLNIQKQRARTLKTVYKYNGSKSSTPVLI